MIYDQVRKNATIKAVNTHRLNLYSKSNKRAVKRLCNQIRNKQFAIDDDFSISGIIAREISKTTWKSFCRFGDRKSASKSLILCWIDNSVVPLDEQMFWINENYSVHVLPEELASFMIEFDGGKGYFHDYKELQDMKQLFKELTGFHYNSSFVNEHILKIKKRSAELDDWSNDIKATSEF